jgi:hypothetical protein
MCDKVEYRPDEMQARLININIIITRNNHQAFIQSDDSASADHALTGVVASPITISEGEP